MIRRTTHQRGDTIVEVMIAFAVFAMLAFATTGLMNSSISQAQSSLETTLVRQQIDAQAELLRYARDTRSSAWKAITTPGNSTSTAPDFTVDDCKDATKASANKRFVIDTVPAAGGKKDLRYKQIGPVFNAPSTYSTIDYNASGAATPIGMWVQAVKVPTPDGNPKYTAYDMHIRACWDTVGQSQPRIMATIVRLYE